jgi:catechol 2,3-dioxygenase-like lactoylglutathione lyase family enzyme
VHVGIERDFRPAKKAHPGLLLASAAAHAALRARLAEAGVAITEGRKGDEGVVSFFVDDPFGNRLELVATV